MTLRASRFSKAHDAFLFRNKNKKAKETYALFRREFPDMEISEDSLNWHRAYIGAMKRHHRSTKTPEEIEALRKKYRGGVTLSMIEEMVATYQGRPEELWT